MFVATLTGFVGRDPETRFTTQGKMFSSFSVAHHNGKRDADGNEPPPEWVKVTGFGQVAELIDKYVRKGMRITVHGNQSVNRWTGRDGTPQAQVQIVVGQIDMDRRTARAQEEVESDGTADTASPEFAGALEEAIDTGEYEESPIPGF